MDCLDFIAVKPATHVLLLIGSRIGGGHDGLLGTFQQGGKVSNLLAFEQSEAVHIVEVPSTKE